MACEVPSNDQASQCIGHFAVDQVGYREFLVAKPVWIEVVGNEGDEDAGIDDPQSPRSSCTAVRIVSRSSLP